MRCALGCAQTQNQQLLEGAPPEALSQKVEPNILYICVYIQSYIYMYIYIYVYTCAKCIAHLGTWISFIPFHPFLGTWISFIPFHPFFVPFFLSSCLCGRCCTTFSGPSLYLSLSICIFRCAYIYIYLNIICIYTYIYIYTYVYTYIYIHVYLSLSLSVFFFWASSMLWASDILETPSRH